MSSRTQGLLTYMLRNTYTGNDLHRRMGILRQCVEHALFTQGDISFDQACEAFLSDDVLEGDAQAVRQWGAQVLTAFTQQNISAHMNDLHAEVDLLPVLTLYIPKELPHEEIDSIGLWSRAQCDEKVLLDIHIDPEVVGGCGFVWNDTYHEFSFRSKIKEQTGVITELLSGYAKS